MAYQDLRGFIDKLAEARDLQVIKAEVDWNQEIGAITRRVCELREAAPLFENIKGCPGHRLAGVLMGPSKPHIHSRVATAFGVDRDTAPLDLVEIARERLRERRNPVLVSNEEAACKEVIMQGDDVNLMALPTPWIHDPSIEGGRYIGTWDLVITKDPDTGWVNWGTYRCMLRDEKSLAMVLVPGGQHGGRIFAKYQAMKRPMPIALVIGPDTSCSLAAMAPLPHGISEIEAAGGIAGAGIPLVKCETIDLEVPAMAEIVIEAEVMIDERTPEGPFGEYTGHVHGIGHPWMAPLAKVKCITHRNNPIFTMANMGKPWDDWAVPGSILQSATAKDWIVSHGIPVKSVYHHAPMTSMVISINPTPGLVSKITSIMTSADRFMPMPTVGLVFVTEDVDVSNLEDVWWAVTTRMHPERFQVIKRAPANPLMPYLSPEERVSFESSYWVMDTTYPLGWSAEYRNSNTQVIDFKSAWSQEVQEKVCQRWREYGFKD